MAWLVPLAAYLGGCAHAVYPPAKPKDPVKVYMADYGLHNGVLLPLPAANGRFSDDGRYIEFVFGDWDYMVNNKETVLDGMGAILLSPQAGLGRRIITIKGGKVAKDVKMPPHSVRSFYASASQVKKLTQELEARFDREERTAMYNPVDQTVYVKDDEHYWLANNCSHTARRWLTELGCDVRGSVVTFGFEIEGTQQVGREPAHTLVTGR